MDGNQELKWVQNPTANIRQHVETKTPNQPNRRPWESVVRSVGVWGEAPAETETGVISTAKFRLLVTLFLWDHENIWFWNSTARAYCLGNKKSGGPDRGPAESPPLSPLFLTSLPLEVYVPINPARGLGERCELPVGSRRRPSLNRIWCILDLKCDIWWQQFNLLPQKSRGHNT